MFSKKPCRQTRVPNRFREHIQTLFSVVALLISGLSLLITLRSEKVDQARYEQLNTPRLKVERIFFHRVVTLDRDSADSLPWGYQPLYQPTVDGESRSERRIHIISQLALFDSTNSIRSNSTDRLLTVKDITTKARELHLNRIIIGHMIKFTMVIRNAGALPVDEARWDTYYISPEGQRTQIGKSHGFQTIHGQDSAGIGVTLVLPFEESVPDTLRFVIRGTFKFMGKESISRTRLTYSVEEMDWRIQEQPLRSSN